MGIKQTIPSNTNTNKTLTLGSFKGIDASSSPFEVDGSRATYCQNLINENGFNHKRNGWKTVLSSDFLGDCKGVFPVKFNGGSYLIVIKNSGSQTNLDFDGTYWFIVYLYKYTKDDFSDLTEVRSLYVSSLEFDNCYCFVKKDKAYLKWIGGYLIVEKDEIYSASSVAHIPTTTISINCDEDTSATRKTYQSANLLSKRRKNTLVGYNKVELKVSVLYQNSNALIAPVNLDKNDFNIILTNSSGVASIHSCNSVISLTPDTYEYTVKYIGTSESYDNITGTFTISYSETTSSSHHSLTITYTSENSNNSSSDGSEDSGSGSSGGTTI